MTHLRPVLILLFLACKGAVWALNFSTVVVDAGHGGRDGGCVHNRLVEKRLCLDVAQRLEKHLKAGGLRVVMTRRTDAFVSLDSRIDTANRQRNALFISIHFNASRNKAVGGMEVYYQSAVGRAVAARLLRSMDLNLKGAARGVFCKDLKVLRETRMPAVLVEGGYLSCKTDAARCATVHHREEMAKALAAGILRCRQ